MEEISQTHHIQNSTSNNLLPNTHIHTVKHLFHSLLELLLLLPDYVSPLLSLYGPTTFISCMEYSIVTVSFFFFFLF